MFESWSRQRQIDLIAEIALLARQAERLASQERATGRADGPAIAIAPIIARARPVLRRLAVELEEGGNPYATRGDLTALRAIVARQVALADVARYEGKP